MTDATLFARAAEAARVAYNKAQAEGGVTQEQMMRAALTGALREMRTPDPAWLQAACRNHRVGQGMSPKHPEECPKIASRRSIWRKGIDALLKQGRAA